MLLPPWAGSVSQAAAPSTSAQLQNALSAQLQQQQHLSLLLPASSIDIAAGNGELGEGETGASALAAVPAQPLPPSNTASSLTVANVHKAFDAANIQRLRTILRQWAQACGVKSDPGSVLVADLLPHYSSLLALLDSQHRSGKPAPSTLSHRLGTLRSFLRSRQQDFEGCVDYAAMLSSLDAASKKYCQLTKAAAAQASQRDIGSVQSAAVAAVAAVELTAAGSAVEDPAATLATLQADPQLAVATATAAASQHGAAMAAAGASSSGIVTAGVSFAQLAQQLEGGGCASSKGVGTLWKMAQSIPGTTADSAAAPVLLWYTDPQQLRAFRLAASTASTTECMQIGSTLCGLLQLLLRPELDSVLGPALRQQRLAGVSTLCLEVEASLQSAGSSPAANPEQVAEQGGPSSREDMRRAGPERSNRALHTGLMQQQQHQQPDPESQVQAEQVSHVAAVLAAAERTPLGLTSYPAAAGSRPGDASHVLGPAVASAAAAGDSAPTASPGRGSQAAILQGWQSSGGQAAAVLATGLGLQRHPPTTSVLHTALQLASEVPASAGNLAATAAQGQTASAAPGPELGSLLEAAQGSAGEADAAAVEEAAQAADSEPSSASLTLGDRDRYSSRGLTCAELGSMLLQESSAEELPESLGGLGGDVVGQDLPVQPQQQLDRPGVPLNEQQEQEQLGAVSSAAVGTPYGPVRTAVAVDCLPQASDPAADGVAAAAGGYSLSMDALLEQLSELDPAPSIDGPLGDCLRQLEESAGVFAGVGLHDIPATLLVTNHIAETFDRAAQCVRAAAEAVVQWDGTQIGTAGCSAVMRAVEGLLQLAGQPVMEQLLGVHRLQQLVDGQLGCKQQLGDTPSDPHGPG